MNSFKENISIFRFIYMTIHGYKEIVQELKKKERETRKRGTVVLHQWFWQPSNEIPLYSPVAAYEYFRFQPEREKEKNKEKLYRHPSNSRTFFLETCRSGCIAFNKLKLEDIPTENSRNLSWIRNKVHLHEKDRKNPRSTTFEFAHFPTFIDISSSKNCKY